MSRAFTLNVRIFIQHQNLCSNTLQSRWPMICHNCEVCSSLLLAAMSEQPVYGSLQQRIIIKFLCNENIKLTEILARLRQQFRENTQSRTQVLY